jgi:hypothetical protein
MGKLSSRFVLEEINRVIIPQVPHLLFEEADPIEIQSTGQRGRRRALATRLDLHALERDSRERAFWIELKTGPGSAEEMAEFQLDCSDCDDIENTVKTSGNIAFLFHVQMSKVPEPPTMRIIGNQIWWTDLFSFANAFLQTKPRRGNERKIAAYFDPSCFKRLEIFADYLIGAEMRKMLKRFDREGCPSLYRR